ncbi:MAG TPA: type II toxin-antitoxin system VapB family antitoxin [Dehalococcoidia bacterium]|nr:type II toxin-antitoxin system VapB family antitoxin [Dehalococcoidia bacterium]
MRTTIDIDEKLLREAEKITGESSPSKAVNAALRELVRRQKLRELGELIGTGGLIDNWREMEELELKEMRERLK